MSIVVGMPHGAVEARPGWGGGSDIQGCLGEELWRQELTFRTEKAEGRARGLQPWGSFWA